MTATKAPTEQQQLQTTRAGPFITIGSQFINQLSNLSKSSKDDKIEQQ